MWLTMLRVDGLNISLLPQTGIYKLLYDIKCRHEMLKLPCKKLKLHD